MYAWHVLVIEIAKAHFLWLSPHAFGALIVLPVTMLVSWLRYYLVEALFLALRYTIATPSLRRCWDVVLDWAREIRPQSWYVSWYVTEADRCGLHQRGISFTCNDGSMAGNRGIASAA